MADRADPIRCWARQPDNSLTRFMTHDPLPFTCMVNIRMQFMLLIRCCLAWHVCRTNDAWMPCPDYQMPACFLFQLMPAADLKKKRRKKRKKCHSGDLKLVMLYKTMQYSGSRLRGIAHVRCASKMPRIYRSCMQKALHDGWQACTCFGLILWEAINGVIMR